MDAGNNDKKPRRRGLTELTLGWIAERFRKAERIKEQLEKGEYQVDSESVAKSLTTESPER